MNEESLCAAYLNEEPLSFYLNLGTYFLPKHYQKIPKQKKKNKGKLSKSIMSLFDLILG